MSLASEVKKIKEDGMSHDAGRADILSAMEKYNQLVKDGYIVEEKPKTFKTCEMTSILAHPCQNGEPCTHS